MNRQDPKGHTVLMSLAISKDNVDKASILLAEPNLNVNLIAPVDGSALHFAVKGVGKESGILDLLLRRSDLNINAEDSFGRIPLI